MGAGGGAGGAPAHRAVVDPLAVAVLQASPQFSGQLAFVHIPVEVRQRVQHHNLQNSQQLMVETPEAREGLRAVSQGSNAAVPNARLHTTRTKRSGSRLDVATLTQTGSSC